MRGPAPTADIKWLAQELGPEFKYNESVPKLASKDLDDFVKDGRPWLAEFRVQGKLGHAIIIDGADDAGAIMIRDPQDGTRYEMTRDNVLKYWDGRSVNPS